MADDGMEAKRNTGVIVTTNFFDTHKTIKDITLHWNITSSLDNVKLDVNLILLLIFLLLSMVWFTYILYYNSRVFGYIVTKIVNLIIIPKYVMGSKNGDCCPYFHLGSFSVSAISGKIMFRDLVYVTTDYSIRIQDGWLIYCWWIPYKPKDVRKSDFSHCDARMSVFLNGFELHIYNRSQLYARLERLFNITPRRLDLEEVDESNSNTCTTKLTNDELIKAYLWRDFFPVTKFEILSARVVFGNPLVPSTLLFTCEESHITYTTRPAISPHDLFTHIMKWKADSFKVILAPSPKYLGLIDEPPRYMGDGFVVFQSSSVDFYYYQDEPGVMSPLPESIELPSGDVVERFTSPAWGLDVKCGKATDCNYGPWADRQRDLLYNFFYPPDFQRVDVTAKPKEGEMRIFESFEFRLSTLADTKIDILFSNKEKETNALHINAGPGSYLEISIPYIAKEDGYATKIVGQILHLDATTILNYRSLVRSETLEFNCKIHYPLIWNGHQTWDCSFIGCKAIVSLIYEHKDFFNYLIDDWAGKAKPDLLQFIPYTWKFSIILNEFELLTMANEHNWIDCTSLLGNENMQVAVCGETFEMSFDLPFVHFLPTTVAIKIWIQGESLEAAIHLPEANPHKDIIFMLHEFAKLSPLLPHTSNSSSPMKPVDTSNLFQTEKKSRSVVKQSNGWIDCWSVPIVALSITYTYYPVPPKASFPRESEITTPEKEEMLLEPIKPDSVPTLMVKKCLPPEDFDPGLMDADLVELELEVGPSTLCLYGTLFRMLWNLKENYLGECQQFRDFTFNASQETFSIDGKNRTRLNSTTVQTSAEGRTELKPFDARLYRPLDVTVSVTMHDIHGHIMKSCSADDPPCPHLYLERLCFEMKKSYRETNLQLLLSPVFLKSVDEIIRPEPHSHLQDGHLLMSSLQFRGHAMFSGLNRPLTSETLEYAWLVEVQIGRIVGRLTLPQIHHLVSGFETFVFQVLQDDCSLQPPLPYHKCVHDLIQSECIETDRLNNKMCPYAEDIKYRMVRLSISSIDVCVAETNTALSLQLNPIRFSTCNLHSCHSSSGITVLIEKISLHQFMMLNKSSLRTSKLQLSSIQRSDRGTNWFEVLSLALGPVFIDSANLTSDTNNCVISQNTFLKTHDAKTKRLWFLWSDEVKIRSTDNKCGCVGGCAFFGSNRNGVYFFNLNDQRENVEKLFCHRNNGDIDLGESLLNPGEPLLGVEMDGDVDDDSDEELTSLNFTPFIGKSVEQQLSPSAKTDDSIKPSIYLFPSTRSKSSKLSLFSRQMSSPARSSIGTTITTPVSSSNIQEPSSLSPSVTAPAEIQQIVIDKPLHKRNRSLSESGAEDGGGLLVKELIDTKSVDRVNSNSLSTSTDPRKRSTESRSTLATDQYFSADEGDSGSSNSDSLTLKTAKSTMQATSIVSDDTFKSIQSMSTAALEPPIGLTEKGSMSQSVLNKSRNSLRSTCSAPPANARQQISVDTQSISSSSFVSALSSQEDLDFGALVDLRNQMEKPIVDSQLLMSCYSNHLSRFKCKNWTAIDCDVPNDGSILAKRSKWVQKFVKKSSNGFSFVKLTKKPTFVDGISDFSSVMQSKNRVNDSYCPGCVFVKLKPDNTQEDSNKEEDTLKVKKQDDSDITKTFEIRSEKITILLKFDQEIDLKVSPLSLDGVRCFIDELIPTLSSLHPLTILNHLSVMCINRVEGNNQLKKEKMLQLGQFKLKAWRTTLERERNLQKNAYKPRMGENVNVGGEQNNLSKAQSAVTANQYEETKVTRIQAFVQMTKINVIVLQASLVEEMIAATALDNIKDVTCVSLLAASIGNIDFEFCNNKKEKRSLHTFVNTNPVRTPPTSAFASFAQHELVSRLFSKKPKKEQAEIEPLTIETHELLSQETMAVGKVGSLHAQLRRLTNSSSILKDAILTIIPHSQSKVNFDYTRTSFSAIQSPTARRRSSQNRGLFRRQECVEKDWDNVFMDSVGDRTSDNEEIQSDFIMFECGLEEISVKAVKNKNDSDKRVVSAEDKQKESKEERKGASFVFEVGVVWFNFAAPPKTPITRKIDFTKLDWHLLSTATPSINAWLTVGERFIITAKKMSHLSDQRISSVVASLMTSALEVQGIHIPPQSKHLSRKVTPFGKALQEDPSCQLMAVLRRFLKQVKSMEEIEDNLNAAFLPSLSDLKRGVVALSRQWKNALYMPLLVEQNIKLNRGDRGVYQIGIPLKLLLGETVKPTEEIQVEFPVSPETQDETENDDEHTILLPNQTESGKEIIDTHVSLDPGTNMSKRKPSLSSSYPEALNATARIAEDGGISNGSAIKKLLPKSSRGSIAFPLLSNPLESLGSGVNKAYGFLFRSTSQNSALKAKRNESQQSLKSASSSSSLGGDNTMSREFFTSKGNDSADYHEENLYIWMLRQQEFVEARNQSSLRRISHSKHVDYDTRCNTLGSANSDDENVISGDMLTSAKDVPPGFAFLPTSVQLADVRVIFAPLFMSLDIDPLPEEPESNLAFDQLGPKVSFCGSVKLFRVDIVECDRDEAYASRSRSPSAFDKIPGGPLKSTVTFVQFSPTANLTKSAFVCERLNVDLDLRKDKEVKIPEGHQETSGSVQPTDTYPSSTNPSGRETEEKVPIVIVGPEGGINELTTVVNFSVDVYHIVQRVNLPLLRLLHQFATMYENIIETRLEMRANRMQTWKDDIHFKQFAENLLNDINILNEVETQSATPSTASMHPTEPKRAKQDYKDHISVSIPGDHDSDATLVEGEAAHGTLSTVMSRPKCWKTMYYLLDLYETTPETKTVAERATSNLNQSEAKIQIEEDEDSGLKSKGGYEQLKECAVDTEECGVQQTAPHPKGSVGFSLNPPHRKSTMNIMSSDQLKTYTHALIHRELTPLIVFGVVKIRKINLVAMFSGLKLDGELSSFHVSLTHKEKFRGAAVRSKKWQESSLTVQLGMTTMSLLEEIPSNLQLVVKMTVGRSQTLISTQNKKGKDANSALLTIGAVNIDIPQHPVALHGMVTRSSKQLSTTLQELRSSRQASRSSQQIDSEIITSSYSGVPFASQAQVNVNQIPKDHIVRKMVTDVHAIPDRVVDRKLIKPFVVQFNIVLDSFTIGASLLPSLRAQYQIGQITSSGLSGTKAKFVVDVREHSLSFNSLVLTSESNMPSSASVSLPPIHVSAEYMDDPIKNENRRSESFADGIVLRKGSFLNALADIGSFEHSLTTDLLNHLLLVQKVFMKEVNEVVQKMSGADMKVMNTDLSETDKSCNGSSSTEVTRPTRGRYLLFTLHLRLKGIQITATTPTNSALRVETGVVELQLSNRVQNMLSARNVPDLQLKLFFKLQVDLNVALGQLIRNALFEEAEPEFQQLAYFKTRIVMRNALQDELVSSTTNNPEDKEAVLITLKRPLLYIQPLALDKAVLVWLNYKNAYEFWNEQRANLNKEVLTATQQVLGKVPPIPQFTTQTLGTLFLQLTVDDFGICLPISNPSLFQTSNMFGNKINYDAELKSALVITLESTRVSACSCGSLVSKAKFTGLCFRFVDDFETSLDDWKPDANGAAVMNLCVVSEGTYEICSRTTTSHQAATGDAKWFLNVTWKMEGFDIHVDTSIGKQFSALFKTLTALAGDEDEIETVDYSSNVEDAPNEPRINVECVSPVVGDTLVDMDNIPTHRKDSLFRDMPVDTRKRSRLIEKELNEQAKIINDLRHSGATETIIEQEIKKLHELESAVFNDFKRDVMKKLRRQSLSKKPSFRDKLHPSRSTLKSDLNVATPEESTDFEEQLSPVFKDQRESLSNESDDMSPLTPDAPVKCFPMNIKECVNDDERELSVECNPAEQHSQSFPKTQSAFTLKSSLQYSSSFSPKVSTTLFSDSTSSSVCSTDSLSSSQNGNVASHSSSSEFIIPKIIETDTAVTVEHQKDIASSQQETTSPPTIGITSKQPLFVQEPNIDFELDVQIFFSSGKCVFHTKDKDEEMIATRNGMKKERSFSGNPFDSIIPASPSNTANHGYQFKQGGSIHKHSNSSGLKSNLSASRLRYITSAAPGTPNLLDYTIFLIPGLDIKIHYNSKTAYSSINQQPFPSTLNQCATDIQSNSLLMRKVGAKKASCYAWMTLHSIPEETIITPHILEFMEQALEPIPIQVTKTPTPTAEGNGVGTNLEVPQPDIITSAPAQYAVYGSFPVDVIVYLHVQPSVLRFSCLPVSRVECLLQLPSVDLVFSSRRHQDEFGDISSLPSGFSPKPSFPPTLPLPPKQVPPKYGHRRSGSDFRHHQTPAEVYTSGLSVTGCLADFSLYIFHPYRGQKKTVGNSLSVSGVFNDTQTPSTTPTMKSLTDRKDSLSLQVEFVKINISRSRNLMTTNEPPFPSAKLNVTQDRQSQTVCIKFSALMDIGSASFKYDMRRLTEILAFPKAWYRKALWKRMFLGDQTISGLFSDQEDVQEECAQSDSSTESESDDILTVKPLFPSPTVNKSNLAKKQESSNRESLWLNLEDISNSKTLNSRFSSAESSIQQQRQLLNTPWDTLILFGVNLSKLNVHMNMGNVMGNTTWLTRGVRSEGRVSIDSSGHKSYNVGLGLEGSSLDAKGGIVGGVIELSQIQTMLKVKENFGCEPHHVITLKCDALEKRLDYMGTSILMLRWSNVDLTLRDEWKIEAGVKQEAFEHPTKRPALIFIHCVLHWDQLQIMMSKSTTPDIMKILARLEEFFSQQFHSSKRVFSSLQPSKSFSRQSIKGRNAKSKPQSTTAQTGGTTTETITATTEARHHRHWQRALHLASGLRLSTYAHPLPARGTILGGTFELNGRHISLACFYGINFRSKSWGLFSLRQPHISFATEAQDVFNEIGETDTHIVQNFSFSLGRKSEDGLDFCAQHSSMANISRISRSVMFPPQFRQMHEWFQYTFSISELDEVNRFPIIEFERTGDALSTSSQSNAESLNRRISMSPKSSEFHHNQEVIFALPSFQMELKTEHLQGPRTPGPTESKPNVDCTFVTDFDDHIYVAVDAEAYFFLHELITSYIKEKEVNYSKTQSPATSERTPKGFKGTETAAPEKDFREFVCHTWHLEPTVRLLSWAGKNIEPYGVDYILQRLGFNQARTTIPKWTQRGAMDPLDKILSLFMMRVISAIKLD